MQRLDEAIRIAGKLRCTAVKEDVFRVFPDADIGIRTRPVVKKKKKEKKPEGRSSKESKDVKLERAKNPV